MPLTVMQDANWSCPHCQDACFAGACRKDPKQNPCEPKNTLLGHDTKRIADARSVECLVDFSVSNLTWLRDDDDNVQESVRIRRAREEARRAKEADPLMDDEDDEEELDVDQSHIRFDYSPDESMIDPQLMDPTPQATRTKGKFATSVLPPPEAMLKGAKPNASSNGHRPTVGPPAGYAPATTSGFAAPRARMYPDVEDNSYAYPDPRGEDDEDEGYLPISSLLSGSAPRNKRNQEAFEDDDDKIYMEGSRTKRRRVSEDPTSASYKPRNEATKQFEKEKERKALDEARKAGRFIAAQAALRGKKRIVRLHISGPRLAQLLAQQAAKSFQPVSETPEVDQEVPPENVLVRSDIAPKEKAKKKAPQHPNRMKIRVERDDDYSMTRAAHPERRKRTANADYEEVDVESDFDSGEDDRDGVYSGRRPENGKRRVSSYIQKKHIDDPDLPDELPENYKDSRSRMEGRAPNRPGPAIHARIAAAAASRHPRALPQLDGTDDHDDDDASDSADDVPAKPVSFEEENRRAKLEALKMVEEEAAQAPPPMHRSIFDRGHGKKIRIVSKSTDTSSPSLGKR